MISADAPILVLYTIFFAFTRGKYKISNMFIFRRKESKI